MVSNKKLIILISAILCTASYGLEQNIVDSKLSKIISNNQLSGQPSSTRPIPEISSPKAQLGMKLFYSKTLGGDNTTACASCHHPLLGGGDNLSLPLGVNTQNPDILGQNRVLKAHIAPRVPRNAPTTFNVAFWKKSMFHDMRITRLANEEIHTPDVPYPQSDVLAGETLAQAQARFPITAVNEMRSNYMGNSYNQTLRRKLADRLKTNWLEAFRVGFSDPNGSVDDLITEQNFSEAIAEYERSQIFINNPWKAYIEGDTQAISEAAKKGAILFYTSQKEGGAACSQCHSGDFFTNERAYNTGMPQIGPGLNHGSTKTNDYGCSKITDKEEDKFRFRTPSLLNVEVTGPWGHDGAYTTLENITRHMLSPLKSAKGYDPKQLTQSLINIADSKANTAEAIQSGIEISEKPNLKDTDVRYLVEFLKTLTDPCVKNRHCLSKWIPNRNENDPDGQTLHAIKSSNGKPL